MCSHNLCLLEYSKIEVKIKIHVMFIVNVFRRQHFCLSQNNYIDFVYNDKIFDGFILQELH